MGVIDLINSSTNLSLDTNILISAFNKSGVLGKKTTELLKRIEEVNPQVFISVIVLEEFLVKIYKMGLEKDLADYENFITGGGLFTVVDVSREIARNAAKLRAQYSSIRAPDALHLASALESGSKIFVTTDRRLPKKIGKMRIEIF